MPTPQPQPPQQNQGQLTPSRFELPDGENYLTSTPDGGWNIADYSDAFDPVQFNDPSNYNGNLDQEHPFNFNWHSNQENAEPEPRVLDQEGQRQLYADPERVLGAQARDRDQQIIQGEEQNRQYDEWEREARERERVQRERRGRALREIQTVQLERERRDRERERDNEVDLSSTSPIANMPRGIPGSGPGGRKRTVASRQTSADNVGAISPPPAKRSKTSNTTSTSQQSLHNSNNDPADDLFGTPPPAEDEVDLVNVNDDEDYEAQKEKRKQEEAKRLREEEAAKPVKLAKQQCVICLDQPTGLVVTHCGMFLSFPALSRPSSPRQRAPLTIPSLPLFPSLSDDHSGEEEKLIVVKQATCSAGNACTAPSTPRTQWGTDTARFVDLKLRHRRGMGKCRREGTFLCR